ncbi:nascent polypeptide-associated complex protein [Candidatus Woesearchaeota archaeon]|nr:nascent polypeptide-associated complex protein [Candidatus Woesearchaeota archaeon]
MMPGMNPRKMQQMMKQMGIQQVEIPATEVIIRTADKEIIITNPSVQKVNMMGNQNFQVSGNITERLLNSTPDISEEDVKTVMEQANVSEDEARNAIEDAKGDLAEAIMGLMKD